ncbi:M24 family metallopeptidase [Alkaliphilus peptidifermentans]|uniref:Xaa-Pro aminopeptidase n=1 Tax=Alkaliphilus peptidifermentans DSM 18978 TaxID=1120976 RepID=A0A1G5KD54_9FIRM|nr:Xaa-Pro peptidase family protein [Alkaliphilus peptidifermentans]SCY98506.1 Xaa-Pro aminopeptidase [Alkaliphilus peptidifermentans DSM 18978]
MSRIEKIRGLLKDLDIDGVLLYKPENRLYASGFTGSTGYVFITDTEAKFFTDFRYLQQAASQCSGFDIVEISRANPITNLLKQFSINKIGFEEDFVTYGQHADLSEKLDKIELIPLKGAVLKLRSIKSPDELQFIEKAASIADLAFQHILTYIKTGLTEKEVALELEYFMKKNGASGLSFESIVASGKRSSLPHGIASDKVIEEGDLITLDFGCVYRGYSSDMTRSFIIGDATEKQKEIYDIVLESQLRSLNGVKPGIRGADLDKIARDYITEMGFGECFGHGLGHGVGLEVHELPHVNQLGDAPMEPGMVITIEPGIYIPDYGGVRIEDLVVVTEDGFKVLSNSTKELIVL